MELSNLAPLEDTFSNVSSDEELYLLESDTDGEIKLSEERRKRIEAWHYSMALIIATDTTLSEDFKLKIYLQGW